MSSPCPDGILEGLAPHVAPDADRAHAMKETFEFFDRHLKGANAARPAD